jgi:hypothetical protein
MTESCMKLGFWRVIVSGFLFQTCLGEQQCRVATRARIRCAWRMLDLAFHGCFSDHMYVHILLAYSLVDQPGISPSHSLAAWANKGVYSAPTLICSVVKAKYCPIERKGVHCACSRHQSASEKTALQAIVGPGSEPRLRHIG